MTYGERRISLDGDTFVAILSLKGCKEVEVQTAQLSFEGIYVHIGLTFFYIAPPSPIFGHQKNIGQFNIM